MKKSSFLALALAPMILGAPMAVHAQSVSTDPVGFVKLDLQPGLQAVGASLLNPAVAAGAVASSDANSITLDGTHTLETSLDAGTAYYVEVASGDTWEGERFEVDVAGSSGSTLAVSASSNNTVSLGAADLSGHSVRVRPHVTLAQIFPPEDLTAGDEVLIFNPSTGGFESYTLSEDIFGGPNFWDRGGNQNDFVLAPGQGALYRNTGAATELTTVLGEVRTNSFRQPLGEGLNHVSEGHPLDNSPNSRMMTEANGFELGDEILVFNPGTGGFEGYTYSEDIFGGPNFWDRGGDQSDTPFIVADGSVFIRKGQADPNYEAPKTF